MWYASVNLAAVVRKYCILIMGFIWFSWETLVSVMLADMGLVGSRPGKGLRL